MAKMFEDLSYLYEALEKKIFLAAYLTELNVKKPSVSSTALQLTRITL